MMKPLGHRERTVLDTIYALHREFPEAENFEPEAVELITGPCAASIGVLASIGLLHREPSPQGWICRMTPAGWDAAEANRRELGRARASFERNGGGRR
jgi:hypothetical protein